MKKLLLISLFLTLCTNAIAQQLHYITGKVKDETGKPLSGVEVFLGGTSRLAVSDEEGSFSISRLATGNYELVAKLLGRETYTANFTLSKSSRFNITLKLKSRQLDEVVIRPNEYNSADYNVFVRTFLGVTPNASQCKILNPKIINIYRDPETKTLHVNSGGEFLIISNPALGYNVKYLLEEFVLDNNEKFSMYVGQALFTEMSGSASKIAKWEKERIKAYLGSPQHLLRSIYNHDLKSQGFIVRNLLSRPNKENISEKDFALKEDHFDSLLAAEKISRIQHIDSVHLITGRVRSAEFIFSVGKDTLEAHSIIRNDSGPNKLLDLSEPLHIVYVKESPAKKYGHGEYVEGTTKTDYRSQMSTISLKEDQQPQIDAYGNLANPLSIVFNGYMGWERVADMLPKDYVVDGTEAKTAAIKKEP